MRYWTDAWVGEPNTRRRIAHDRHVEAIVLLTRLLSLETDG